MLLHFLLSSSVEASVPVTVRIKCPVCLAPDVAAQAYDMAEEFRLFHLIPFTTDHTSWVICPACGAKSKSEIPAAELARLAPGDVNLFVQRRMPPALLILLVVGLPTAMLPGIGLVVALLSLHFARRYGRWARGLAICQVVLNVLGTLVVVLALVLPEPKYVKPVFAPRGSPAPANSPKPRAKGSRSGRLRLPISPNHRTPGQSQTGPTASNNRAPQAGARLNRGPAPSARG